MMGKEFANLFQFVDIRYDVGCAFPQCLDLVQEQVAVHFVPLLFRGVMQCTPFRLFADERVGFIGEGHVDGWIGSRDELQAANNYFRYTQRTNILSDKSEI